MTQLLMAIFTLFLLFTPASQAAVYQWTDDQGNIGFTDDPDSIPQKYRQNAERLDAKPAPQKPKSNVAPVSPPAAPPAVNRPAVDDEGRDEQWWRTRMQDLRNRKKTLQNEKTRLMAEGSSLGKLGLGSTDENQAANETENQIQQIDGEIERIENELTVVAPEEARRANAPPGWLRE